MLSLIFQIFIKHFVNLYSKLLNISMYMPSKYTLIWIKKIISLWLENMNGRYAL